jgi:osmoprotectant transport system ATP-binding protein
MDSSIVFDRVFVKRGSSDVLRDLSITIEARTFVSVVGRSGAGKSTLLKCINRLIEPDSGAVRVCGEDVRDVRPDVLRRSIGYVFQGVGLFPHMTVAENIGITPRLRGDAGQSIDERVAALMDLVNLPRMLIARLPHQLSGGQQQRVGIARALAAEPAIMILDEPFGSLDPATRDSLSRSYRDLHERLRLTTVMVTHDMAEALLLSDRIVVLESGTLRTEGTPAEMLRSNDEAIASLVEVARRNAESIATMARVRR